MKLKTLLIAILVISPMAVNGQPRRSTWPAQLAPRDRDDIEKVFADQDRAYNAGDAAGFAGRALENMTLTNAAGALLSGKQHWQQEAEATLSSIGKGSRISTKIEYASLPAKDTAVLQVITAFTGLKGLPPEALAPDGAVYVRIQQVLVRNEKGWWVASIHSVPVQAAFLPK